METRNLMNGKVLQGWVGGYIERSDPLIYLGKPSTIELLFPLINQCPTILWPFQIPSRTIEL